MSRVGLTCFVLLTLTGCGGSTSGVGAEGGARDSSTPAVDSGTTSAATIVAIPACAHILFLDLLPTCGDGTVDAGETCDDGNEDDSDGCTSTCGPT